MIDKYRCPACGVARKRQRKPYKCLFGRCIERRGTVWIVQGFGPGGNGRPLGISSQTWAAYLDNPEDPTPLWDLPGWVANIGYYS